MKKNRSIYFVLTGFIILSIALYMFKDNRSSKEMAFTDNSNNSIDSMNVADSIKMAALPKETQNSSYESRKNYVELPKTNSNEEKTETQNPKEKSNDVTLIEAKEFIQNRISTRNGFIVDYCTNSSYGHKLYNFLVSYGGQYCLMIVSDISLEILSSKCGNQVINQFEEIKMLSR